MVDIIMGALAGWFLAVLFLKFLGWVLKTLNATKSAQAPFRLIHNTSRVSIMIGDEIGYVWEDVVAVEKDSTNERCRKIWLLNEKVPVHLVLEEDQELIEDRPWARADILVHAKV